MNVVVTGSGAGIGRATALEFGRKGLSVGLISRDETRLESVKNEIEALGAQAHWVSADVADAAQIENAAEELERVLGNVDIWVNNAMATVFSPFLEISPEEYKRATEVTYLGTVYGTMAALRRMYARNHGTLIQVGSALAYRSIPLQAPYCGAKHAILGFTDSIRSEIIHDRKNIRICMVQLPAHNTPQFSWGLAKLAKQPQPVPPIYQPEVAAQAIVWSAFHPRRELIVGWPAFKAIVGQKIVPGYIDRVLSSKGYSGQMKDEPMDPQRPANLFEPVPGPFGAHGIFDKEARKRSTHLWLTTHRGIVAVLILAVIAAMMIVGIAV